MGGREKKREGRREGEGEWGRKYADKKSHGKLSCFSHF